MPDFTTFPVPYKTGVASDIGALPVANPAFTGTLTGPNITTTGNTILGNASTDTLDVGNGGLIKDASGNVCIGGATTNPGAGNTTVGAAISPSGLIYSSRASDASALLNTNADGSLMRFYRSGTQVGSISVTTTNTTYNLTSDERLKENISPARPAGAVIDGLQVREFDFKAGGHVRHGFIAQELAKLCPEAVTEGGEDPDTDPWAIDPSKLIPMLVKEIQELRSRVAALEG